MEITGDLTFNLSTANISTYTALTWKWNFLIQVLISYVRLVRRRINISSTISSSIVGSTCKTRLPTLSHWDSSVSGD